MANLAALFNEQIRRLARREIRAQARLTRKLTAQHRRDIAAMKRDIAAMRRTITLLQRLEKRRNGATPAAPAATPDGLDGVRFRADGVRSHRARLGLSAKDYGRLVGVSGLTIYHWESGKARPRQQQLAKLVAIRGLGKREAAQRLEMLAAE